MRLSGLFEDRELHAHVLGKRRTRFVELHDAPASVMLAMPRNLVRSGLVEAKAERRLALPHLTCDIVTTAELVRKALPIGIQDKSAHTTEGLSGKELDFGIRIIGLHKASWMNLHPFQVDTLCTNGLAHLDAVTGAVLAISSGQMHEVRAIHRQERLLREVSAKAAAGQDNRPILLHVHAALFVDAAHHAIAVGQQLVHPCLGDDACPVRLLRYLFHHLDQSVSDCHSWEALFASVRPWGRMAAKACNEREIEVKLFNQPINVRAAVGA
mmetsp:Transcript_17003/g.25435  ORF Transcript_17003/g.25435 Transcript_17003/m.25435 type:complete len:269 (-) Transcript_17003:325-1131(-)